MLETPEVSHISSNPSTGITTLRINPNKLNGFVTSYSDFLTAQDIILNKAGINSNELIRVDMCFDSYDPEHYQKYAKLNRLLISMFAQAYCVQNKYRTTELFTNRQLSIAIKNPNSFEVENYDKAYESLGKDRAQSRFEIRSTRMGNQSIENEFIHNWNTRFDKALAHFDDTLARYNDELIKTYLKEKVCGNGIKYATFFQMYENCIFTRKQAIALLTQMGVNNPSDSYKYLKKKYNLITYTKADVVRAVAEIKRARDVFFWGN